MVYIIHNGSLPSLCGAPSQTATCMGEAARYEHTNVNELNYHLG